MKQREKFRFFFLLYLLLAYATPINSKNPLSLSLSPAFPRNYFRNSAGDDSTNKIYLLLTVDGTLSAMTQETVLWSTSITSNSMFDSSSSDVACGEDGTLFFLDDHVNAFPITIPDIVYNSPTAHEEFVLNGSKTSTLFSLDISSGSISQVSDDISHSDSTDLQLFESSEEDTKRLGPQFEILIGIEEYKVTALDQDSLNKEWSVMYRSLSLPNLPRYVEVKHFGTPRITHNGLPIQSLFALSDSSIIQLSPFIGETTRKFEVIDVKGLNFVSSPLGPSFLSISPEKVSPQHLIKQPMDYQFLLPDTDECYDGTDVILAEKRTSFLEKNLVLIASIMVLLLSAGLFAFSKRRRYSRIEEKHVGDLVFVNSLSIDLKDLKGRGCNGTMVFGGKLGSRSVAVKRLLAHPPEQDGDGSIEIVGKKEIEMLIRSDGHPNVVRYFAKETTRSFVYLALELCSMTLEQAIIVQNRVAERMGIKVKKKEERDFILQVTGAISHLHQNRIVHRDLKPSNILVVRRQKSKSLLGVYNFMEQTANSLRRRKGAQETNKSKLDLKFLSNVHSLSLAELWTPKISDMGLSKHIQHNTNNNTQSNLTFHTFESHQLATKGVNSTSHNTSNKSGQVNYGAAGSVGWRAPELLMSSNQAMVLTKAVDAYALGLVFYYIFSSGQHPFGGPFEREQNMIDNKFVQDANEQVNYLEKDLATRLVTRDVKLRLRVDGIPKQPYFWGDEEISSFFCRISEDLRLEPVRKTIFYNMCNNTILKEPWVNYLAPVLKKDLFNTDKTKISHPYDFYSCVDLVRFFRNKKSHLSELQQGSTEKIVSSEKSFVEYFLRTFPNLLSSCISFQALIDQFTNQLKENQRYFMPANLWSKLPRTVEKAKIDTSNENTWARGSSPTKSTSEKGGWERGVQNKPEWRRVETRNRTKTKKVKMNKRELCAHWERTGGTWCAKGKACGFAHGIIELRHCNWFS
eukprot:maker-scaffold_3-snap-gene-15.28-mRNA-1 protein AED:0.33 eAED:0.33 QI:0/1/0/1/1/1/2/0/968